MVKPFSEAFVVWLPETKQPLPIPIAGHCTNNGKVIINFPGWNGEMDGYDEKYVKLGKYLASTNVASFVRTKIPTLDGDDYSYGEVAQNVVRSAINWVLGYAKGISGLPKEGVELYLIGTSAGGGAIASVGHEFAQVKKLLLINPAFSDRLVNRDKALGGISSFRGEVAIVVGGADSQGIKDCADLLKQEATSASSTVRLQVIPDADHHLSGTENGKLLSLLPRWAFASREAAIPDSSAGIELY